MFFVIPFDLRLRQGCRFERFASYLDLGRKLFVSYLHLARDDRVLVEINQSQEL